MRHHLLYHPHSSVVNVNESTSGLCLCSRRSGKPGLDVLPAATRVARSCTGGDDEREWLLT